MVGIRRWLEIKIWMLQLFPVRGRSSATRIHITQLTNSSFFKKFLFIRFNPFHYSKSTSEFNINVVAIFCASSFFFFFPGGFPEDIESETECKTWSRYKMGEPTFHFCSNFSRVVDKRTSKA